MLLVALNKEGDYFTLGFAFKAPSGGMIWTKGIWMSCTVAFNKGGGRQTGHLPSPFVFFHSDWFSPLIVLDHAARKKKRPEEKRPKGHVLSTWLRDHSAEYQAWMNNKKFSLIIQLLGNSGHFFEKLMAKNEVSRRKTKIFFFLFLGRSWAAVKEAHKGSLPPKTSS